MLYSIANDAVSGTESGVSTKTSGTPLQSAGSIRSTMWAVDLPSAHPKICQLLTEGFTVHDHIRRM